MKKKLIKKVFYILAVLAGINCHAQVTREPYLQIPTPAGITVKWQTGTGVVGKLWYGLQKDSLDNSISEPEIERIYHEVRVSGLAPGTRYYYSVEGQDKGDENQYFNTPPVVGASTPVRIWIISDFGQTNSDQNERRVETVERWKAFNNDDYRADLVLSPGDQTEGDVTYQLQHNYFSILRKVLRNSLLYTTIGNHDDHDSLRNYLKTFVLPAHGEAGGVASNTEKYYSVDYSNIHVVVLCSEIYDSAGYETQLAWLRRDLSRNHQSWLIACMHQPLHSAGYHPTDDDEFAQRRRNDWLRLLEDHGVDLILQGHNHVYERS